MHFSSAQTIQQIVSLNDVHTCLHRTQVLCKYEWHRLGSQHFLSKSQRRDSSVSVVTRLRIEWKMFDYRQRQELFPSLHHSYRLWGPSSLTYKGHRGALSPTVKQPEFEYCGNYFIYLFTIYLKMLSTAHATAENALEICGRKQSWSNLRYYPYIRLE